MAKYSKRDLAFLGQKAFEVDHRELAGHAEWKSDKGPQLDKYSRRDDSFLGGKKVRVYLLKNEL